MTARLARELRAVLPELAAVSVTPVWTDASGQVRRRHLVLLVDGSGRPCGDRAAARLALGELRRAFPEADWNRVVRYDVEAASLRPAVTPVPLHALAAGGTR